MGKRLSKTERKDSNSYSSFPVINKKDKLSKFVNEFQFGFNQKPNSSNLRFLSPLLKKKKEEKRMNEFNKEIFTKMSEDKLYLLQKTTKYLRKNLKDATKKKSIKTANEIYLENLNNQRKINLNNIEAMPVQVVRPYNFVNETTDDLKMLSMYTPEKKEEFIFQNSVNNEHTEGNWGMKRLFQLVNQEAHIKKYNPKVYKRKIEIIPDEQILKENEEEKDKKNFVEQSAVEMMLNEISPKKNKLTKTPKNETKLSFVSNEDEDNNKNNTQSNEFENRFRRKAFYTKRSKIGEKTEQIKIINYLQKQVKEKKISLKFPESNNVISSFSKKIKEVIKNQKDK